MFHSSSSSCSDCSAATPAINVSTLHGYFDANAPSFPPTLLPSSPPYSSSLPPYYYLPRSSSTHSLPLHHHNHSSDPFNPLPFSAPHKRQYQQQPLALGPVLTSSSLPSSSRDFIDFNAGPVRRVFSTGDLQGLNGMLSSGDNYNQDGGTIPGRVGRYSAEERKERVERYRSKRNQRNFQKKITYACRKTLADSRPRVRGRFARNGETEAEAEAEVEENNYVCYSHNSCEQTQNSSGVGNGNDWLRQMQAALGADEEDERFNEEDLWATISDAFLVNHLD